MKQVHLKLLFCLLLATSISGRYTGSQLDQNFGARSSGQPSAVAQLAASDTGYASSSYGLSNVDTVSVPSYSYGRKKRSTKERKKRFFPGGIGAPMTGFIRPGGLPGSFMPLTLLPPILPPMTPPVAPLPPPIVPPPFPPPMISEFSLASPFIRPIVPPIPLPLSGIPGGGFGGPFGGPFGGFISEPFFDNPFDTDFGLGGGFRFSNEYDGSTPDAYFEPFPFPGGYDTYGKVLDKIKQNKASNDTNKYSYRNSINHSYGNNNYGKSYSNSYYDDDDNNNDYSNSYSNDNNKAYGYRKKNSHRKKGIYKPKPRYNDNDYSSNDNDYNYRKNREYGLNVERQQPRLTFNH